MQDRKKDEFGNESLTVRRFAKNTAIAGATLGTTTSLCLNWLLNNPRSCSGLVKEPRFASAFLVGQGAVVGGIAGLLLGAGVGITYFKVKKKMKIKSNDSDEGREIANKFK